MSDFLPEGLDGHAHNVALLTRDLAVAQKRLAFDIGELSILVLAKEIDADLLLLDDLAARKLPFAKVIEAVPGKKLPQVQMGSGHHLSQCDPRLPPSGDGNL
jgi:hypothetical protein